MGNQEEFIQALEQTNRAFRNILEKDREHYIIPPKEYETIDKLSARNEELLKKMQDRDFTVAIVGLEKAGKSTLGNALIGLDALPEYTERCTYTTTEVCAGSEDRAEIAFYSYEEFNSNFSKMLEQLKYPMPVDFRTFQLVDFQRHWESMRTSDDESKTALYNLHDNTTAQDLREMLEQRNTILPLLGAPVKTFLGEAELEGDAFKKFITGYAAWKTEADGARTAIRSGEPYAVKKVKIFASGLKSMANIRLFDVPGFDSPTRLHKAQTEAMLKEADAIILVTDVGSSPNFKGTQIDMLNKGILDDDGIALSQKAFVFGNRLDVAGSQQNAKNNAAVLHKEAVKWRIAQESRVYCGSAKLYRDAENGKAGQGALFGLPLGVGELRSGLQTYYDTDRFAILEQRARKRVKEAREVLQHVLDESAGAGNGTFTIGSFGSIVLSIKDAFGPFYREAHDIVDRHVSDIRTSLPFSTDLKNSLEEMFPSVEDETLQALLEEARKQQQISVSGNAPVNAVDFDWRKSVQNLFRHRLVQKVATMTQEREQDIRREVADALLSLMQIASPNAEQRAAVTELFEKAMTRGGEKCYFTPLVDRFATNLMEVAILDPFGSEQRRNFFKQPANLAEMNVLSTYYVLGRDQSDDFDGATKRAGLFPMLLAHEGIPGEGEAAPAEDSWRDSAAGQWLQGFFEENKDQLRNGFSLTLDLLPMGKWTKMLTRVALTEKNQRRLENALERVLYGTDKKKDAESFENVITSFAQAAPAEEETVDRATYLDRLMANAHVASEEEMQQALNEDITILREVMRYAVIEAMGLEQAFDSTIVKNIEFIRELRDKNDVLNPWIKKYASVLRPTDAAAAFSSVAAEATSREIREEIERTLETVHL